MSLTANAVYAVSGAGEPAPATPATSPETSPPASPVTSPQMSPEMSPAGSPSPQAGGEVDLVIGTDTGQNVQFVPDEAEVPAGAEVSLTFENRATVPHNLTFQPPIDAATSTIVAPGDSETIEFTAPTEPGDYGWVCTIHPGMEGTLRVSD